MNAPQEIAVLVLAAVFIAVVLIAWRDDDD